MRKILVVGAGQAGLQLALDLLRRGYDVTVVSDRTPDGIAAGKVMSSQCMFGAALQTERRLGIDLRSGICPTVDGIQLTVPGPDGSKALHWAARLDAPAQSVDQRVKIPRWMRMLEQRGGKLLIHDASAEDLQTFLPWEAERARGAALTDDNGVLTGRFAPTVRKTRRDAALGAARGLRFLSAPGRAARWLPARRAIVRRRPMTTAGRR